MTEEQAERLIEQLKLLRWYLGLAVFVLSVIASAIMGRV